ncbi:hypothetical protein ABT354_35895 [Streptomyces sp. NPDC000594]|uniref:hypothetical protein n=1 Tax=Streptomyces sp. NPDC000594 TaxID=3154261 RepID=UPI0033223C3D
MRERTPTGLMRGHWGARSRRHILAAGATVLMLTGAVTSATAAGAPTLQSAPAGTPAVQCASGQYRVTPLNGAPTFWKLGDRLIERETWNIHQNSCLGLDERLDKYCQNGSDPIEIWEPCGFGHIGSSTSFLRDAVQLWWIRADQVEYTP